MKTVELKAHAKLNLYLNIKHKRADGFHELETVMLPISLADDVRVSVFDSCNCKTNVKMVGMAEEVPLEKNLAWKSAEKFRNKTSFRNDIEIEICKNIPAGAGMGGGSSDAASVLVALNSLTGEHLSTEILQDLASDLGSDVPFFILNQLSICTGRGEIIHPVKQKLPQKRWFVIAVPEIGVNTALAYKCFSELPTSPSPFVTPRDFLKKWLEGIEVNYFNSLHEAALKAVPELVFFEEKLPGDNWYLTGSGSSFFHPVETGKEAENFLTNLRNNDIFLTFVVSSL